MGYLLLAASVVAFSVAAPAVANPDWQQQTKKKESVPLNRESDCQDPKWQVVTGEGLTRTSIEFLQGLGQGVGGLEEGSPVPVRCADGRTVSGWIDKAGELQSMTAPEAAWFVERRNGQSRPVGGVLELISDRVRVGGAGGYDSDVAYSVYVGKSLTPYSRRLLSKLGIGTAGLAGPVKVRTSGGSMMKGTLSASGALTVSAEPWK